MVGFQKRYFTIFEDSNIMYLLYDKLPPTKEKKPKGAIKIGLIKEVITKETSREFTLKFSTRDFILRAESILVKKQWIKTLEFLRDYSLQNNSDKVIEEPTGKEGWRFQNLDQNLQRNLRIHIEKKNQDQDEIKEIEIQDEQMQKAKGIFTYFEKFSEDLISNHVVQGFLFRKKEKFTNKVSQPKRFWLIMFSEFGLISSTQQDQILVDDLPPFMSPNVLYYYEPSLEESHPYGKFHVREIQEIRKIDLKSQEGDNLLMKGFGNIGNGMITAVNKITEITKLDKIGMHIHRFEFQFQVIVNQNGKEYTHNFYSESLLQIEKWVSALTKVRDNYKTQQEQLQQKRIEAQARINRDPKPTKKDTHDSEGEEYSDDEVDHGDEGEEDEDDDGDLEQTPWRDVIVYQSTVKTKVRGMLNVVGGWDDKVIVLKRQIILFYKEEKDIEDEKFEKYVLLKDIESVQEDKKDDRFQIVLKKSNEQQIFILDSVEMAKRWTHAIKSLIENEFEDLDELRRAPVILEDPNKKKKKNQEEVESLEVSNGKSTRSDDISAYSSIDSQYMMAFQGSKILSQAAAAERQEAEKKKKSVGLFSRMFGCCIDGRAEGVDDNDQQTSNAGNKQLQRKLID